MNLFYQSGPYGVLFFLLITVLLGGAASLAAGRALASTWRPAWLCILYAAPIAATIGFLHYALFQEPVIPLYALGASIAEFGAAPLASAGEFMPGLRGFLVLFFIHSGFALAGYRLTRVRQMITRYRFACQPQGLLSWRVTPQKTAETPHQAA